MRALNAVKLERVFAKPFVGNLGGHRDGVSCFAKHPASLSSLTSGAFDGEVRVWDLPQRKCIRNFVAHEGNKHITNVCSPVRKIKYFFYQVL